MNRPKPQRIAKYGITVRSKWEANVAHLLEFLRKRGDVLRWDYEAETFYFTDKGPTKKTKYKQGPWTYKIDFRVWWRGQKEPELLEVKGRANTGDKTRMLRMKKHYPEAYARIRWIDGAAYRKLEAAWSRAVEGWQ